MFDRIKGVFKLDVNTFEDVERDESATMQAFIIVVVVAVLAAIGGFLAAQTGNQLAAQLQELGDTELPFAMPELSPTGVAINAFVGVLVGWVLWSGLTYLIGVNLFGGQATFNEMLRVLGYAQAPRFLSVFAFIPCLGGILSFVGGIWALVAGFVGIRQGLDLDNVKTLITVVLSWLVALLVNLFVLGPILGGLL